MSTRDQLLALATRCEAASGHDLKLDFAIGEALDIPQPLEGGPDFTASLDAALSLVPNGWTGSIAAPAGPFDCWAEFHDRDEQHPLCKHGICQEGQTPALATCAAALRARAALA